jgi:hypothetical protein
MTLGGVDTLQHTNSIAYTPLGRPTGWFTVTLLDITVAGRSIGEPSSKYNSGKGIIVDSGTTGTSLPRSVEGALIKVLASARLQYSTARISIPATRLASLPTLTFHFADGRVREHASAVVPRSCCHGQVHVPCLPH